MTFSGFLDRGNVVQLADILSSRVLDFTRGLTVLLIEAVRLSPGSALEYPELISSEDRI